MRTHATTRPSGPPRLRLRLRVVHKLFLLLALAVTLALGALGGLTIVHLRRGFVAYVNSLDLARLAGLAQTLSERDDATQNFPGLRDPAHWQALLLQTLGPTRPDPAPPADLRGPQPPPPPPAPANDQATPTPPLPLALRVALLDARRRLIAGAPPVGDALQRPLLRGGAVIGWLALRPLTRPVDSRDTDFLTAQARGMAVLAALLILLALVVAYVFARHLLAPLGVVERAAEQLANGRYRLQLDTSRRDELGDLVRHVNRLSAALQAHEDARRRWIADISHELRTPLSIVRGEVEAMQDGVRRVDAEGLQSLHDEVLRLTRLVDDLHQLSMADLGTLSYRPARLDLAALLREACTRFAVTARQAGLALEPVLSPAWVQADPDRMRQLIDNVLGNSLRYSDPGGCVRIELSITQTHARVVLDDTPPGVESDALARLFEPLFRAEASRNRDHGGSGLGLAIAQRIAIAHGGELRAEPSPLGGLRIVLTLPLAES